MAEKMEILVEKQRRGARSNQKLKILYLAKILLDNTDANHDITLQEIIDKLSANNVTAERKSLYDDIARLDEFGIKIKKTQYGKTYHYQVVKRDFELAELKLLVNSERCKTFRFYRFLHNMFESFVNSERCKTVNVFGFGIVLFESFVNSERCKTMSLET